MKIAIQKYRLQDLTRRQQVLSLVALCFAIHYLLGVMLWSLCIYSQTVVLLRATKPALFWWAMWEWLPFYSRCWKSATPFVVALLASYLVPERPKVAFRLICCLLAFTLICASYDIARVDCDMRSHDPAQGERVGYYFTWWWHQQRLP